MTKRVSQFKNVRPTRRCPNCGNIETYRGGLFFCPKCKERYPAYQIKGRDGVTKHFNGY